MKRYIKSSVETTTINPSDVKGITLLSVDEAETVSQNIRAIGEWYWLRDPGTDYECAAVVGSPGYVNTEGYPIDVNMGAVRPALIVPNLSSYNLPDYSKVNVFDRDWYVLNDFNYLLLDKYLGMNFFDKRNMSTNEYETSGIKKSLEDWLVSQLDPMASEEIESSDIEVTEDQLHQIVDKWAQIAKENCWSGIWYYPDLWVNYKREFEDVDEDMYDELDKDGYPYCYLDEAVESVLGHGLYED